MVPQVILLGTDVNNGMPLAVRRRRTSNTASRVADLINCYHGSQELRALSQVTR